MVKIDSQANVAVYSDNSQIGSKSDEVDIPFKVRAMTPLPVGTTGSTTEAEPLATSQVAPVVEVLSGKPYIKAATPRVSPPGDHHLRSRTHCPTELSSKGSIGEDGHRL